MTFMVKFLMVIGMILCFMMAFGLSAVLSHRWKVVLATLVLKCACIVFMLVYGCVPTGVVMFVGIWALYDAGILSNRIF
jgi:hypothetical protein